MNMAKSSFCIFTLAVFFGGAAADESSDRFYNCVLPAYDRIGMHNFFRNLEDACQNVETKLTEARQAIKKCGVRAVDINDLEYLYKDVCDKQSNYRRKFEWSCIRREMDSGWLNPCTPMYSDIRHGKTLNEICQSVSKNVSQCFTDFIGRRCGLKVKEMYGRMEKATEPLYELGCLAEKGSILIEISGDSDSGATANLDPGSTANSDSGATASSDSGATANSASRTTANSASRTTASSDSWATANSDSGTTANSAFIWSILLGLLLTVKWW